MKRYEIENWALNVIERVESHQPIEDFRVELKSYWPEPQKAARRIAGHANAARGEPILWLIGIDEKEGVVKGAAREEMADWYDKVKAQFNGLAPTITDLNVPVKGTTVVALLFETDRAPFVVKNPNGGTIQFEVPWRENTSVRSANRSDLIKLLSPLQKLPNIEILSGRLTVKQASQGATIEENLSWNLHLKLYGTPKTETRIVIPFHRCEATFEVPGFVPRTTFENIHLAPPFGYNATDMSYGSQSFTINGTETEVLINGPGMLHLDADAKTPVITKSFANPVEVNVNLFPADAEYSVQISETLACSTPAQGELGCWSLE